MAVEKLAVSLEQDLARAVRAEAERQGSSLSGWLADAARWKLRASAAVAALADYELEHGAITDAEMARLTPEWDR